MADFIEVMRQAKRMCSSFGGECSDNCPLNCAMQVDAGIYSVLCIFVGGGDMKRYKEIEARVMQWAKEHYDET